MGHLQSTEGGQFKINCNSMGVQFIEAESDSKHGIFGDSSQQYANLVPTLDYSTIPIHERPLLLVQLSQPSPAESSASGFVYPMRLLTVTVRIILFPSGSVPGTAHWGRSHFSIEKRNSEQANLRLLFRLLFIRTIQDLILQSRTRRRSKESESF